MALIVEDGTGKTNSESYSSVSFADTYHANQGNTAWAGFSTSDKEVYLRRATAYMEQNFRSRWAGFRHSIYQALSWPRSDAIINDLWPAQYVLPTVVPVQVQEACASLALRASAGSLTPDQGRLKEKVKVGPIETTYVISSSPYPEYREVLNMLDPYFSSGSAGGSIEIVRS